MLGQYPYHRHIIFLQNSLRFSYRWVINLIHTLLKSHVYMGKSRNDFRYSQANFDRSLFVCVSDHNRHLQITLTCNLKTQNYGVIQIYENVKIPMTQLLFGLCQRFDRITTQREGKYFHIFSLIIIIQFSFLMVSL